MKSNFIAHLHVLGNEQMETKLTQPKRGIMLPIGFPHRELIQIEITFD